MNTPLPQKIFDLGRRPTLHDRYKQQYARLSGLNHSGRIEIGALGETRTRTACATAPSRQRVYQFHHQSDKCSSEDFQLGLLSFTVSRHFFLERRQLGVAGC